jgi:hypothetical protein
LEEKLQKLLEIQNTRAEKLIPGRLRRGNDFPTDYLQKTYKELVESAGKGDEKARVLKKIIEQEKRLGELH